MYIYFPKMHFELASIYLGIYKPPVNVYVMTAGQMQGCCLNYMRLPLVGDKKSIQFRWILHIKGLVPLNAIQGENVEV